VPVWKKSVRRKRQFFRQNSKIAIFSGALLVFTTYIVNEVIKENVHGRVEELQSAKDQFEMHRDHGMASDRLDRLNRQLHGQEQQMDLPKVGGLELRRYQLEQHTYELADTGQGYVEMLKNVSGLWTALPQKDRDQDYEKRLSSGVHAIYSECRRLQGKMFTIDPTKEALDEVERTATIAEGELLGTGGSLSTEAAMASMKIDDAIAKEKKRYEMWKKASYCLYVIGWGLALAGRLNGSKSEELLGN